MATQQHFQFGNQTLPAIFEAPKPSRRPHPADRSRPASGLPTSGQAGALAPVGAAAVVPSQRGGSSAPRLNGPGDVGVTGVVGSKTVEAGHRVVRTRAQRRSVQPLHEAHRMTLTERVVGICSLYVIGATLVATFWLHAAMHIGTVKAGYRVRDLRAVNGELEREHLRLRKDIAELKAPDRIAKLAVENLGLVLARPDEVIDLPAVAPVRTASLQTGPAQATR